MQPYSVQLPFNPQRPQVCQTHARHHLSDSLLPLGNCLLAATYIVTAHHTSIFPLTRNLILSAKWAQQQIIPHTTSSAKLNSNAVSTLPYNYVAVTILKESGMEIK